MKEEYPELDIKLTDHAIEWITQFGNPIIAKDFVGYTVKIDDDFAVAVDLNNKIVPFSLNPKKPLNLKRAKKLFKQLMNTNFVKDATYDPFPDFEKYSHIPFDLYNATNINGYAFKTSFETQDDSFIPDDDFDVTDISNTMKKFDIKIDENS